MSEEIEDVVVDTEVGVKSARRVAPAVEPVDEETGVDKLATKAAEALGYVDEETKVSMAQLRAAAMKNAAYKKAIAAQKARGVIKVLIWVAIVIIGVGIVYLGHALITKGPNGLKAAVRKITGHGNGYGKTL